MNPLIILYLLRLCSTAPRGYIFIQTQSTIGHLPLLEQQKYREFSFGEDLGSRIVPFSIENGNTLNSASQNEYESASELAPQIFQPLQAQALQSLLQSVIANRSLPPAPELHHQVSLGSDFGLEDYSNERSFEKETNVLEHQQQALDFSLQKMQPPYSQALAGVQENVHPFPDPPLQSQFRPVGDMVLQPLPLSQEDDSDEGNFGGGLDFTANPSSPDFLSQNNQPLLSQLSLTPTAHNLASVQENSALAPAQQLYQVSTGNPFNPQQLTFSIKADSDEINFVRGSDVVEHQPFSDFSSQNVQSSQSQSSLSHTVHNLPSVLATFPHLPDPKHQHPISSENDFSIQTLALHQESDSSENNFFVAQKLASDLAHQIQSSVTPTLHKQENFSVKDSEYVPLTLASQPHQLVGFERELNTLSLTFSSNDYSDQSNVGDLRSFAAQPKVNEILSHLSDFAPEPFSHLHNLKAVTNELSALPTQEFASGVRHQHLASPSATFIAEIPSRNSALPSVPFFHLQDIHDSTVTHEVPIPSSQDLAPSLRPQSLSYPSAVLAYELPNQNTYLTSARIPHRQNSVHPVAAHVLPVHPNQKFASGSGQPNFPASTAAYDYKEPSVHSCTSDQVLSADGLCVEPEIIRSIFSFKEPEEDIISSKYSRPPNVSKPKVKLNLVVIQANEEDSREEPIVITPPQEKTVVLVLKKDEEEERKIIEVPAPIGESPEVFFVNYRDGENPSLPGGIDLKTALASSSSLGERIRPSSAKSSFDVEREFTTGFSYEEKHEATARPLFEARHGTISSPILGGTLESIAEPSLRAGYVFTDGPSFGGASEFTVGSLIGAEQDSISGPLLQGKHESISGPSFTEGRDFMIGSSLEIRHDFASESLLEGGHDSVPGPLFDTKHESTAGPSFGERHESISMLPFRGNEYTVGSLIKVEQDSVSGPLPRVEHESIIEPSFAGGRDFTLGSSLEIGHDSALGSRLEVGYESFPGPLLGEAQESVGVHLFGGENEPTVGPSFGGEHKSLYKSSFRSRHEPVAGSPFEDGRDNAVDTKRYNRRSIDEYDYLDVFEGFGDKIIS